MSLISVPRAPCVPFSSRPKQNSGQFSRSKLVRCAAASKDDGQKTSEIASSLGKACMPFAAAAMLLAQSSPAFAETPYESSLRVQKEFQASGSRLDQFLNKGTSSSEVLADAPGVKAGISGNPVDAAKGVAKEAGKKQGGLLGMFSEKAPSPDQAASKVAEAAPKKGGFFGFFNKAPKAEDVKSKAEDVKSAVGDAASSAKSSLPPQAPNPGQAAEGAKNAAEKIADAAPGKGLGGIKDAASDALPDNVAAKAKEGAKAVADAAPNSPGEAIDSAKQGLKDSSLTPDSPREALANAKGAADSAKDAVKDVAGAAKDEAEVVGSGDKAPSGGGFFSQFLSDTKSTAEDAAGSAQEAAGDVKEALPSGEEAKNAVEEAAPDNNKGIFAGLLGGADPKPAKTPSNQIEPPQPSQLEEDSPKGAAPLPEQPYPESEAAVPAGSSGADSAGSKFGETVEDTESGGGLLDLFGGPPSGKSQEQKKEELVQKAEDPNPASNFLGDLFGDN